MVKLKWTSEQKLYLEKLKNQHDWDLFAVGFGFSILSAAFTSLIWGAACIP